MGMNLLEIIFIVTSGEWLRDHHLSLGMNLLEIIFIVTSGKWLRDSTQINFDWPVNPALRTVGNIVPYSTYR